MSKHMSNVTNVTQTLRKNADEASKRSNKRSLLDSVRRALPYPTQNKTERNGTAVAAQPPPLGSLDPQ
jgi:hypothetical protein